MYHPTTSIAGIAAALTLLSSQADAAVQVFAPSTPYRGSASDMVVTFDPRSGFIASTFDGGPLTFCISQNMFQATISSFDWDGTEARVMPWVSDYTVGRQGINEVVGDSTIGDESFGYIDFTNYTAGETFFIGFGFRAAGTTDDFYYGFAEVAFFENGDIEVHQFAYNDEAGASITTAPIPEPGSAMLAAAGVAFGALGIRRRARREDKA